MASMKEDAERDLLSFVKMMWHVVEPAVPLSVGWCLEMLCDVLMAVSDGDLTRVCINVPPGSMKSTLLNVFWAAWEWGPCGRPDYRYLSASYSDKVPTRDNLRFAQIITHPVYRQCWGSQFDVSRTGAEWVGNNRTGWKAVTSVSGSTTGLRGDRLLLDDLNNPQDVESDAVRQTAMRFVREIMPDRLNNLERSAIINLQQRTHEWDATGTILEWGQGYTFICVPAEFDPLRICQVVLRRDEDGTPIDVWTDPRALDQDGRRLAGAITNERGEPVVDPDSPLSAAEGESFWPDRFSEEALRKLKIEKGAYAWDCNPYCAPILMADLTEKPIGEIRVGDEIVGFETDCSPRRPGEKFARRRLVRTVVREVHVQKRKCVRLRMESGQSIICTENHKWYTGRSANDPTHPMYAPATVGRRLMRIYNPGDLSEEAPDSREAGWLAGFYEGEGTVCSQSRRDGDATNAIISFAQGEKNLPICEELERVLAGFGFEWGISRKTGTDNPLRIYWLKRGGLPLYQKFLHIVRPIKWRDRIIEAAYGSGFIRREDRVVDIGTHWPDCDPVVDVYGLTTDTGNYVVWGCASSNSQYQQFPGIRGGAVIRREWWKTWKGEYPAVGTVIVSLDTAIEEGESNDYNAVTVWGAFPGEHEEPLFLLMDAWRERCTIAQLVYKVAQTCRGLLHADKLGGSGPHADYLLIEDKTRGKDVADEIQRLYQDREWEVVRIKPQGDKVSRLRAVSHLFSGDVRQMPDGGKDSDGKPTFIETWSGGMVYAPDRAWVDEVIAEVASFPYGAHDDWTDTVSQALGWARKNGVALRKEEHDAIELERNRYRKLRRMPYSIRKV